MDNVEMLTDILIMLRNSYAKVLIDCVVDIDQNIESATFMGQPVKQLFDALRAWEIVKKDGLPFMELMWIKITDNYQEYVKTFGCVYPTKSQEEYETIKGALVEHEEIY